MDAQLIKCADQVKEGYQVVYTETRNDELLVEGVTYSRHGTNFKIKYRQKLFMRVMHEVEQMCERNKPVALVQMSNETEDFDAAFFCAHGEAPVESAILVNRLLDTLEDTQEERIYMNIVEGAGWVIEKPK